MTDDRHTRIDRNGNAISFFKVMGRKPELLRRRHLQIEEEEEPLGVREENSGASKD